MDSKVLPWGAPPPPELTERYLLGDVLGKGAMGAAVRAVQRSLDRPVVLKLMPLDEVTDPTLVQRFEAEARILGRISHPRVLPVVDYGVHPGLAFVAYPDLGGVSLDRVLAGRGSVPPEVAAEWLGQVLEGLSEVHRVGIVHRDLKPANVLRAEDGGLRIFDFGLARDLDRSTVMTRPGAVLGTPLYMPPEQIRGEDPDPRDDLYAAGVLCYRALSGSEPFAAPTLNEILDRQLGYDPPPLHTLVPGVPQRLSLLVQDLMAKDRRDRPGSAASARARLTGEPPAAGFHEDGPGAGSLGTSRIPASGSGRSSGTYPGSLLGAWVGAGLVVAVGIAVGALWGRGTAGRHDGIPGTDTAFDPGAAAPRDEGSLVPTLAPSDLALEVDEKDGVPFEVAGLRPRVSGWLATAVLGIRSIRARSERADESLVDPVRRGREVLLALSRSVRTEPDSADLAAILAALGDDVWQLAFPAGATGLDPWELLEDPLPGPAGALVEAVVLAHVRRVLAPAGDPTAPEPDEIRARLESAMAPGGPAPWAGERCVAALDRILAGGPPEGPGFDFAPLVELRRRALGGLSQSARSRTGARLARAIDASGSPLAPGLAALRARLFETQVDHLLDDLTGPGSAGR